MTLISRIQRFIGFLCVLGCLISIFTFALLSTKYKNIPIGTSIPAGNYTRYQEYMQIVYSSDDRDIQLGFFVGGLILIIISGPPLVLIKTGRWVLIKHRGSMEELIFEDST